MGALGQVAALVEIDAEGRGQGLRVEIHQLERNLDKQTPRGGFVVNNKWRAPQRGLPADPLIFGGREGFGQLARLTAGGVARAEAIELEVEIASPVGMADEELDATVLIDGRAIVGIGAADTPFRHVEFQEKRLGRAGDERHGLGPLRIFRPVDGRDRGLGRVLVEDRLDRFPRWSLVEPRDVGDG